MRYQQEEKDTPYALLWPSNNTLNLWVRWDEKKQSPIYPNTTTCRARFHLALVGHRALGGVWSGSLASAWTDSCQVTSASFELSEEGDSLLAGWVLMEWTGNCGASRITLPLRLARQ